MSGVIRYTMLAEDKAWTARIFTEDDIVQQDGIRIMLSRIVEDVINTLGVIPQYSAALLTISWEKPDTTGSCEDTTKS